MFGRTKVRVFEEEDGVIYDSDTAEILHWYDRFTLRIILAVTPSGHYFHAILRDGLLGPRTSVIPIRFKASAIYWAAKESAPDETLEKMGVRILNQPESDEPYNFMSADVIWPERWFFGWRALMRNYDGRLWMLNSFSIDILGIRAKWTSAIDQRKAIAWAIMKGASGDKLKMLGIEDTDIYKRAP